MPQLTVERVEEYAAAHTQASDPQPDHFRDNLAAVVECMNEGTEWTDAGLYAATHMLGQALRNRIEVDRYVSDVPAVDEGALVTSHLSHRAASIGHHVFPVPVRPGSEPAHAPHLGGRPAGASSSYRS